MEEERETAPNTNVLTTTALRLYQNYSAKGLEVPSEELASLRKDMGFLRRIDRKEFDGFRSAIGDYTLKEKIVLDGKNAGRELMRLLFGAEDAKLLDSVMWLTKALNRKLRDYKPGELIKLYNRVSEELVRRELSGENTAQETKGLISSWRRIGEFIKNVVNDPYVQESTEFREELVRQIPLQKELEARLLRSRSVEGLEGELARRKELLAQRWNSFKRLSLARPEEYSPIVKEMLRLGEDLKNLRKEIAERRKIKEPAVEPQNDAGVKERIEASARMRLAKRLYEKAETVPEEAQELYESGLEYESIAESLLKNTASLEKEVENE